MPGLFDSWPDDYESWFATPMGRLIKGFELELILDMLSPQPGELILDAGCGTGIFTSDIVDRGALVTGVDISRPMLKKATAKISSGLRVVCADMLMLPFKDNIFDRTMSVTAIEFIQDAGQALCELERVTKPGGIIVAATLNSLSPWADRRRKDAEDNGGIFAHAVFRSPYDLAGLLPYECTTRTTIHFSDDTGPDKAMEIEEMGRITGSDSGAFVSAMWIKQS